MLDNIFGILVKFSMIIVFFLSLCKAGCDRIATDCGKDLEPYGIASMSLWPGPVQTEEVQKTVMGK